MLEELLLFLVEAVWVVAFPAVHTLKCLKGINRGAGEEQYQQWTYFWILYACMSALEGYLSWLPAFCYLRILFLAYLAFPPMKGPLLIYNRLDQSVFAQVRPMLSAFVEQVKPQH